MEFPVYRKLVLPAGPRGRFATNQFFKFLSASETLNVRLDNVFSIGYAKDMPENVVNNMLNTWVEATADEFRAAFDTARRAVVAAENAAH